MRSAIGLAILLWAATPSSWGAVSGTAILDGEVGDFTSDRVTVTQPGRTCKVARELIGEAVEIRPGAHLHVSISRQAITGIQCRADRNPAKAAAAVAPPEGALPAVSGVWRSLRFR